MQQTSPAELDDPAPPRVKQIKALAIILREEFGIAFRFLDAQTGQRLEGSAAEAGPTQAPPRAPAPEPLLEPAGAAALFAAGAARVRVRGAGFYQLELPLSDICQPPTIAVGTIAGLARTPAEVVQEQARLGKWLSAIHSRLV